MHLEQSSLKDHSPGFLLCLPLNGSSSRNFTGSRIVLWLETVDSGVRMLFTSEPRSQAGYKFLWALLPSSIKNNKEDNSTDLIWLFHEDSQKDIKKN